MAITSTLAASTTTVESGQPIVLTISIANGNAGDYQIAADVVKINPSVSKAVGSLLPTPSPIVSASATRVFAIDLSLFVSSVSQNGFGGFPVAVTHVIYMTDGTVLTSNTVTITVSPTYTATYPPV